MTRAEALGWLGFEADATLKPEYEPAIERLMAVPLPTDEQGHIQAFQAWLSARPPHPRRLRPPDERVPRRNL